MCKRRTWKYVRTTEFVGGRVVFHVVDLPIVKNFFATIQGELQNMRGFSPATVAELMGVDTREIMPLFHALRVEGIFTKDKRGSYRKATKCYDIAYLPVEGSTKVPPLETEDVVPGKGEADEMQKELMERLAKYPNHTTNVNNLIRKANNQESVALGQLFNKGFVHYVDSKVVEMTPLGRTWLGLPAPIPKPVSAPAVEEIKVEEVQPVIDETKSSEKEESGMFTKSAEISNTNKLLYVDMLVYLYYGCGADTDIGSFKTYLDIPRTPGSGLKRTNKNLLVFNEAISTLSHLGYIELSGEDGVSITSEGIAFMKEHERQHHVTIAEHVLGVLASNPDEKYTYSVVAETLKDMYDSNKIAAICSHLTTKGRLVSFHKTHNGRSACQITKAGLLYWRSLKNRGVFDEEHTLPKEEVVKVETPIPVFKKTKKKGRKELHHNCNIESRVEILSFLANTGGSVPVYMVCQNIQSGTEKAVMQRIHRYIDEGLIYTGAAKGAEFKSSTRCCISDKGILFLKQHCPPSLTQPVDLTPQREETTAPNVTIANLSRSEKLLLLWVKHCGGVLSNKTLDMFWGFVNKLKLASGNPSEVLQYFGPLKLELFTNQGETSSMVLTQRGIDLCAPLPAFESFELNGEVVIPPSSVKTICEYFDAQLPEYTAMVVLSSSQPSQKPDAEVSTLLHAGMKLIKSVEGAFIEDFIPKGEWDEFKQVVKSILQQPKK